MSVRVFLVWLLCLVAAPAWAQTRDPILRIETGTHTAKLTSLAADAAGRVLVTASDDKTARVWSLPGLRPLGVLRPPIGAGNIGKLYAVAVSPDGQLAALGGWLDATGTDEAVLLFDLRTRQVIRRWHRLPGSVQSLCFSLDGGRLAAGLDGENGLRVWNVADGRQIAADDSYANSVEGISFAPDGRLVTASDDGFLRLYDAGGQLLRKARADAAKDPFRIAFSPDGADVAVGFDDAAAVEIRDGRTLELRARPDVSGLDGGLESVAWGANGDLLYAGGDPLVDDMRPTFVWDRHGRGGRKIASAHFSNSGGDLVALRDGSLVVSSAIGDIAVNSGDGHQIAAQRPSGANLETAIEPSDESQRLLISPDARRVSFAQFGSAGVWTIVDAAGFEVRTANTAPPGLTSWTPSVQGMTATDWNGRADPKVNGKRVTLEEFELARSASARPNRLLLGTDWNLRMLDAGARTLWENPAPGAAWRVNQSLDGRLAVAALDDGTVRWFRASDGRELLALFLTNDAKRWVAFTPSGYYTASPGGEDLIGWHVNRGIDKAADFFPAAQFRDRFYRPDVVTRVLDTLDEAEALKQADAARGAPVRPAAPITQDLPPVITILSPADGTTISGPETTLGYSVRSPSGKPLRAIHVLLNGRPAPAARGLQRDDTPNAAGEMRGQVSVAIPAGQTVELALLAESDTHISEPAKITLKGAPAAAPPPVRRSAMYALVIGVSDYADPRLKLGFAAKDAADFAARVNREKHGGGLYRDVQVKLLADKDASRGAVLDGLDWLRQQTTAEDVAVLFIAGHGTNDRTGHFYVLPADVDIQRLRSTAIAGVDMKEALAEIPGRVVAFLDTCHSGNVLGGSFRSAPDMNGLANELSSAEAGTIVFASSTGSELSEELPSLRNGAFTSALLEALSGKADTEHKGAETVEELNFFVLQRVKALTDGEQHPNMLRPSSIRDFPLFTAVQ